MGRAFMEQKEQGIAAEHADSVTIGKRPKKPNGYWSIKSNVIQESKNYSTKSEMKLLNNPAYNGMCKLKLSDELFPKGKKSNGHWTNERIFKIANSYSSFSEFMKSEGTAYTRACERGILIECCSHMDRVRVPNNYWNESNLIGCAKRFNTISEFKNSMSGAYSAARDLGIIHKVCSHMVSGYKKTNACYIWKAIGLNAYKVGVSMETIVRNRANIVAKAHGLEVEWIEFGVFDNPHAIEKEVLSMGGKYKTKTKSDGYTEFRTFDKEQIKDAIKTIKATK